MAAQLIGQPGSSDDLRDDYLSNYGQSSSAHSKRRLAVPIVTAATSAVSAFPASQLSPSRLSPLIQPASSRTPDLRTPTPTASDSHPEYDYSATTTHSLPSFAQFTSTSPAPHEPVHSHTMSAPTAYYAYDSVPADPTQYTSAQQPHYFTNPSPFDRNHVGGRQIPLSSMQSQSHLTQLPRPRSTSAFTYQQAQSAATQSHHNYSHEQYQSASQYARPQTDSPDSGSLRRSPDPASSPELAQTFYDPFQVKHRRRTTTPQLKVLEGHFAANPKPDIPLRKTLAEQLGMTPREVQVWFQNRRAKTKRMAKKTVGETDLPRMSSSETMDLATNAEEDESAQSRSHLPVPQIATSVDRSADAMTSKWVAASRQASRSSDLHPLTRESSSERLATVAHQPVPTPSPSMLPHHLTAPHSSMARRSSMPAYNVPQYSADASWQPLFPNTTSYPHSLAPLSQNYRSNTGLEAQPQSQGQSSESSSLDRLQIAPEHASSSYTIDLDSVTSSLRTAQEHGSHDESMDQHNPSSLPSETNDFAHYLLQHNQQQTVPPLSASTTYSSFTFDEATAAGSTTPTSTTSAFSYATNNTSPHLGFPAGFDPDSRRASCPAEFINSFGQLGMPHIPAPNHRPLNLWPNQGYQQPSIPMSTATSDGLRALHANQAQQQYQNAHSMAPPFPAVRSPELIGGPRRHSVANGMIPYMSGSAQIPAYPGELPPTTYSMAMPSSHTRASLGVHQDAYGRRGSTSVPLGTIAEQPFLHYPQPTSSAQFSPAVLSMEAASEEVLSPTDPDQREPSHGAARSSMARRARSQSSMHNVYKTAASDRLTPTGLEQLFEQN